MRTKKYSGAPDVILPLQMELLREWCSFLVPPPGNARALALEQSARLQRLIAFSARKSAYYREMFDRIGVAPEKIRTPEDLVRLPVLEKAAVWKQKGKLVTASGGPAACQLRHTSGTTGTHLELPVFSMENLMDARLWARCYLEGGHHPWRRQARIAWESRMPRKPYGIQRLGWFRREYLNGMNSPGEKIEWLRRMRPYSFVCWAGTLDEIMTELERTGEFMDIPLVFSTCSILWPHVRRRAEQRMTRRVLDTYGAVETGPIAWECEQRNGMHVCSEAVIVELLDENGRPAPRGRVVCTVLWRRVFPLIRYALGDTAEWADGPCPCGRPDPVLKKITGREEFLMTLPDGTRVSSLMLRTAALDKPGVEQYHMVQDTPRQFRLRVVTGAAFTLEVEQQIRQEWQQRFGNQLEFRIVRVRELRTPAGRKPVPMISLEYLDRLRSEGADLSCFYDDPPSALAGG